MTTPSTPAPGAEPAPKSPRKGRGPIDQKTLDQLEKDQQIIKAVIGEMTADSTLATALGTHFLDKDQAVPITLANVQTLDQQADAARAAAGSAVGSSADFHDVTAQEDDDTARAVAAIRRVQGAAKEKYEEGHREKLGAYFVGQELRSRQQITTTGTALYALLRTTDDSNSPVTPKDTLPGYDADKIAQLKTDLGQFAGIQTAQSGAQKTASESRTSFAGQADQITRRRRRLQRAIDVERPHSDANNALRTRLGLPTDRAMS